MTCRATAWHILAAGHRERAPGLLALWLSVLAAAAPAAGQQDVAAEPEHDIEIVNIDHIRYEGEARILYGEGNVEVIVREPITEGDQTRWEAMTVTADALVIDRNADTATFAGRVRIERPDVVITQERLVVQLESRATTSSGDVSAQFDPEFFPGVAPVEPVFLYGEWVHIAQERNFAEGHHLDFTTCDLAHPHYSLLCPDVDVWPGKRLILRKPRFRLFGRTIFRSPWDIPVSLERRQPNVVPTFGDSATEGLFAHFAFPYTDGPHQDGAFRLNLTQERGVGIGLDHFLRSDSQTGDVFLLWEPSEDSLVARGSHYYTFSSSLYTETRLGFQSNSGFALGATESLDLDFALHNEDRNSSFELGFRTNRSQSASRSFERTTIGLRDFQNYGAGLTSNFNATFRRSSSFAGLPDDLELIGDLALEQRDPDRPFDWRLRADRRFDVDGSDFPFDDQLQILERFPEIAFDTSSRRLGMDWLDPLPLRATFSWGNFRQRPLAGSLQRTYFGIEANPERIRLADFAELDWRGDYSQAFYSDGNQQYVIGSRTSLGNRFGDNWRLDLDWDYQKPHGGTPLRLDVVGSRNVGRASLSRINRSTGSRLYASTGYDFRRDLWQDAIFRGLVPVGDTTFDFAGGYSIERQQWRPLVGRVEHYSPGGLSFGLSSRYDIERAEFGSVRAEVDWPLGRKWHIESLLGYNPQTRKFDFADVRVTRDLHCWIASVTWSQQQQLLMLNVGIKAFPFAPAPLGLGTRGQGFDTTPGQYY